MQVFLKKFSLMCENALLSYETHERKVTHFKCKEDAEHLHTKQQERCHNSGSQVERTDTII